MDGWNSKFEHSDYGDVGLGDLRDYSIKHTPKSSIVQLKFPLVTEE